MINDADEITPLLRGSVLEGREVRTVDILGTGELGFEITVDGTEVLETWSAARTLLDVTGRWPLAVDYNDWSVYSRSLYHDERPPRAIAARAEALTWPALKGLDPPADDWVRWITFNVEETVRRVDDAPDVAELLRRFPQPNIVGLEATLLAWEEERRPTSAGESPGAFEPCLEDTVCALVLLPTSNSSAVPAYAHYWGTTHESDGAELLVSAIGSWHQRYGAEPYSSMSVELAFVVERPPTDVFDAFALATEQSMFSRGLDTSLRDCARALLGSERWSLHARP